MRSILPFIPSSGFVCVAISRYLVEVQHCFVYYAYLLFMIPELDALK